MKILIKQKYKSIDAPSEFELPEFSILTGKNGSGKTHLLEAIGNYNTSEVSIYGNVTKNIKYIQFNGLNPRIEQSCSPNGIDQYVKMVWNDYNNAKQRLSNWNQDDVTSQINEISDQHNARKFVAKTIYNSRKPFHALTEDDLANSFDPSLMETQDFFTAQFALIFKNYQRKQLENDQNTFYQSKNIPISNPVLTDTEFIEKYGNPPWDFVNKILDEVDIPYKVNNPIGSRMASDFDLKFLDKTHGFTIRSEDLSTGERTLMCLALAVYNSSNYIAKPSLLLIDEPDAGLHPSMSKKMVHILEKNIVKESGIQTIISTHSPTTVIAAEGISLYQLVRGNSIPIKTSIQEAVETLSGDIPFLRITTEKKRQVFVESKYDVTYYELLSNIYRKLEDFPAEPTFIAARTTDDSNCADVIHIVKELSTNGNDQVYGIIDWDESNKSNGKVLVLGENNSITAQS